MNERRWKIKGGLSSSFFRKREVKCEKLEHMH